LGEELSKVQQRHPIVEDLTSMIARRGSAFPTPRQKSEMIARRTSETKDDSIKERTKEVDEKLIRGS
jgi:hypothetical protein